LTWMRLDDKFWRNPKLRRLSHAARGVFADSLSFCGDTDELTGFLTTQQALDRAAGPTCRRLVAELIANENLEVVNGGYLIHDFEHYIPKTSRERTRAWREKKRLERHQNVTTPSPLSRARDGKPVPVPEPVPEGSLEPSVVPLQQNGLKKYGIPETSMHVSGPQHVSKILGGLKMQPVRKESA
jgi:hypothetical protein